jgi:hypothetical protein
MADAHGNSPSFAPQKNGQILLLIFFTVLNILNKPNYRNFIIGQTNFVAGLSVWYLWNYLMTQKHTKILHGSSF